MINRHYDLTAGTDHGYYRAGRRVYNLRDVLIRSGIATGFWHCCVGDNHTYHELVTTAEGIVRHALLPYLEVPGIDLEAVTLALAGDLAETTGRMIISRDTLRLGLLTIGCASRQKDQPATCGYFGWDGASA